MSVSPQGLVGYVTAVQPSWLDYNEHMNVAYYMHVFDNAGERLIEHAGMGETYTRQTQNSWMILESHITYQNEARLGEQLRVESRVLDCGPKLVHLYQEMFRDELLLSTCEQLLLHVSLSTRKSSPFTPAVLAKLEELKAMAKDLVRPAWIGRTMGLKKSQ